MENEWPTPVRLLSYDRVKQYGPFSPRELGAALRLELITPADAAALLEDDLGRASDPYRTWTIVEKLRSADSHERRRAAEELATWDPSGEAPDPLRPWYLILARDAVERYSSSTDVIRVLDQIWDDYGRPPELAPYTAIGNVVETRPILDEADFNVLRERTSDYSEILVEGLRRYLDKALLSRSC